jgi:hypothetical protein
MFSIAFIAVECQDYQHPSYAQLHGEFVHSISAIDLQFNLGNGGEIILKNQVGAL